MFHESRGFVSRRQAITPYFSAPRSFRRCSLLCAIIPSLWILLPWHGARAAELDGVRLSDTLQVGGTTLHLNGAGMRTWSVLGIHVYVAGLYLTRATSDPGEILQSPEPRLLTVTFRHDVSAQASRDAWREGLENNCQAPCRLDPADMRDFLASVPDMRKGDSYALFFTRDGAAVSMNGRQVGVIPHPLFAQALLATFLGPRPASPALKQDLLGLPSAGGSDSHSALINPR